MFCKRTIFLILTILLSNIHILCSSEKTDRNLFEDVERLQNYPDEGKIFIFEAKLEEGHKFFPLFKKEKCCITSEKDQSLTQFLMNKLTSKSPTSRDLAYLKILIAYRHRHTILITGDEVSPNLLKQLALSLTPENNNPSDDIVKLLYDIQTLASTDSHNCALNKAVKEAGADRCSEKLLDLPGLMPKYEGQIKSQCMERIRKSSQN